MTNLIEQSDLILFHLEKILSSGAFKGATRLQQFLGFVVEQYCEGRADEIKQYTIGVEAFSLGDDFDPSQDAIIRIVAGKVRRRLTEYYSTEGVSDELIIEIPKGSYVPVIVNRDSEDQGAILTEPFNQESLSADKRSDKTDLTIAIVPFENISGDQKLDYFALGLSEEISSVLSSYKDFVVVPPIATRHLSYSQLNIGEIAQNFGARYVLDASIRKSRDLVRVVVRLTGSLDFNQLWVETYDTKIEVDNLLDIQEDIALKVATSIANEYGGAIPRKIASGLSNKKPVTLSAYEASLHIHHYNLSQRPALIYDQTVSAIQVALEDTPNNPILLSSLAELKLDGYAHGWSDAKEIPAEDCETLINKALNIDRDCAYAYFALGLLKTNQRKNSELLAIVDQLIAFNHSSSSLAQAGWFMAILGNYEDGLELLDQNLDKIRYYPGWFRHAYFLYHFQNDRYEDALAEADKMNTPGLPWNPLERAASLGKLGRFEEGNKAIDELLHLNPVFFDSPRRYLKMFIIDDDLLDDVLQGLELCRKNRAGGKEDGRLKIR